MSLKQGDTVTSIEAGRQNPASVVTLDLSDKQLKEIDLEILMFDNLEELILDGNPELRWVIPALGKRARQIRAEIIKEEG